MMDVKTFVEGTGNPPQGQRIEHRFYLDQNQVVRWESNNQVPFADMLSKIAMAFPEVTPQVIKESIKTREAEVAKAIGRYQSVDHEPSAEELFEMRAAFGEGETVVNVFTGRKTRL
jgi:transcriptional regulator with XRE-family HTH domain